MDLHETIRRRAAAAVVTAALLCALSVTVGTATPIATAAPIQVPPGLDLESRGLGGTDDPFVAGHERALRVAPSPEGATTGAQTADLAAPAAVTGAFDPTWSGDGWAPFPSRYSIALAPYSPNRIFSASYSASDGGQMRITKFDTTGAKFVGWGGANGYVLRSFHAGFGGSFPTHITSVGSQVVVAGEDYTNVARLGVARLNADGSYDNTFSGDGRNLFKIFNLEHDVITPFRVDVLSGGKIGIALAAWDQDAQGTFQFTGQAMLRLNANGLADTSFSGDGKAVVPNDWYDIQFLPNGGAYVNRQLGNTQEVRRLQPSGALDPTFSGDGIATTSCGAHTGSALWSDPAGRPLVMCAGVPNATNTERTLTIVRFTTSGVLDTSYSGDGRAPLLTRGTIATTIGNVDTNGNPWIAVMGIGTRRSFRVYAVDGNGNPDVSWSDDGVTIITMPFDIVLDRIVKSGNRVYLTAFKDATNVAIIALTAA